MKSPKNTGNVAVGVIVKSLVEPVAYSVVVPMSNV